MAKNKGVLAIDVGSSKVCAVIGEQREGKIWITGKAVVPSKGLRRGAIINIEEASQVIKEVVDKALSQADCDIEAIYTNISGTYVSNVRGMGIIALKEKEVTPEEVERVLEAARAIEIPEDKEILQEIPQEFAIDNQRGILQPIGMSGIRMEVHVQFITVQKTALQNLLKCFEFAGINVNEVIFQGIASAEAVLTEEEKDLGVLLLDFGGGTIDGVVFWEGVLREVFSIPVGGEHFTHDLALGLRTSKKIAEKIKIEKGVCLKELANEEMVFEVPGIGSRPAKEVNQKIIAEILEPRAREVLELIEAKIEELKIGSKIAAGIVFTGGSALIPGLTLLADQILEMPARIGYPVKLSGVIEELNHPQYATAVGLILGAFKNVELQMPQRRVVGLWEKIKNFFLKIKED